MPIKTPVGDAPIIPVLIIMIGGYLTWFGVHYFKSDVKWPTDPVKSVLTGGQPTIPTYTQEQQRHNTQNTYVSGFASGTSATVASSSNTGSAIADAAMQYVGSGYVWGGPADKPGNWDCSSFVSYVLGHDLGLPLPGGNYGDPGFPPHTHGPTTGTYLLYGTPVNQSELQAGDLVVWASHMGIATDNAHIVSARDPKDGVGVSGIASTTQSLGEDVRFRRIPSGGRGVRAA